VGFDIRRCDLGRSDENAAASTPGCYSFSKYKLNITLPHNIQIILVTRRDHAWSSKGQDAIRLKIQFKQSRPYIFHQVIFLLVVSPSANPSKDTQKETNSPSQMPSFLFKTV